jgi:hypothetical protein
MPPGRASLRSVLDESCVGVARSVVEGHGGVVEQVAPEATSMCVSLSYNHVTLRAKRADPSICHLQLSGPALVEHLDEVRATLPQGGLHLEASGAFGRLGFGSLYLSRFVDTDTLYAGVARLQALGVHVTDPHTWMLGNHGDLSATLATAAVNDPKGLCNPGKLPR